MEVIKEAYVKATSAALSEKLMDGIELDPSSEKITRLADVLSNVVRDITTVNAWKPTHQQAMTHKDIEIDMDDDAVPCLFRASRIPNPSGDIDSVVAQALEQLAIFAHSSHRQTFLQDGGLQLLTEYATSPHIDARSAAAAGIANLLMLKEAADDAVFRLQLVKHKPSILTAISKLIEDKEVLAAKPCLASDKSVPASGPIPGPDGEEPSIFEIEQKMRETAIDTSHLGKKIGDRQKLGYGGMASLPLASNIAQDRDGPNGITNCVEHAIVKTLLHLSAMPRLTKPSRNNPPPPAILKLQQQGMVAITQHFYADGGLEALCSCARKHSYEDEASMGDVTIMSMLVHTVLNLAHMATEPDLLKMVISFVRCPVPRVHVPAVGVICKLARAPEAKGELLKYGAVDALIDFTSPTFTIVEEVIEGKVGSDGGTNSHSKISQAAKQALAALS